MKKISVMLTMLLAAGFIWAGDGFQARKEVLTVDVCINPTTASATGFGSFILRGYIYPAGTITFGEGINEDGSPEFPELLIGMWTCQGWGGVTHDTPAGRLTASTAQTYEMAMDTLGNDMIITHGFEIGTPVVVGYRAIIGGTGQYADINGVQEQMLIGQNITGGGNIRVSFVSETTIDFKNKPRK